MAMKRFILSLGLLLGSAAGRAASGSPPARARPDWPVAQLHPARRLLAGAGERRPDQPRRQAHRLCPPDRRHIDRTPTAARSGWSISPAGAQRPLGVAGSSRPRWSPDGTRIAFAAKGEDGKVQIFVHWLATGVHASLAVLPESPSDIAWSPDQKRIAFTMFVPARVRRSARRSPSPRVRKWAEPVKVYCRSITRGWRRLSAPRL